MPQYTFTTDPINEQQQITDAFNAGPTSDWQVGNHVQFYSTITTILQTDNGSGSPDQDPDVLPVRLWFEGATKVNSGEGAFSTLIREYTQAQGELHWNRRFSDEKYTPQSLVISEMQEASNRVARKAEETLTDQNENNWTLQTITDIATNDATAVGEVLFDFNTVSTPGSTDTINSDSLQGGQNAAWSGTLLFSSFDNPNNPNGAVDQTFRLISTGPSASTADTLDDWRNVTYAAHAYSQGFSETMLQNGPGLTIDALSCLVTVGNNCGDLKVFGEVYALSGFDSSVAQMVDNKIASESFSPAILYGEHSVISQLKGAKEGVFPNLSETQAPDSFSDYFKGNARDFFGTPGPQNQSINATVHRVIDLVYEAQINNLIAQKSLQGLSIFKVSGGNTLNLNVSPQYWVDRGQMTKARLTYDAVFHQNGVLLNQGGFVLSPEFDDTYKFTDIKTNTIFRVASSFRPVTPASAVEVQFGSSGAEVLTGGVKDDSLYGLDGTDSLNGGLGDDFLSGGEGIDNYVVNDGKDVIFDSDGLGSVQLNGEMLIGGERLGGNVWDSTDGRFRYQLLNTFQGSQLVVLDANDSDGSLIINGFTSGNLGIELENANDPMPPVDTIAPEDNFTVGTLDNYSSGSPDNDLYNAGNLYDNISDFQGGDDVVLLGSDGGFSDRVSTAFGNDVIYGEVGNDYILAGVGHGDGAEDKDTVIGGADVDLINTGVGDDLIIAGEEGENINATNTSDQGDWIVADEGNDVAHGTGNQDFITMGNGADVVYAGGGFDVILADGYYRFSKAAAVITDINFGAREHVWNSNNGVWDTSSINYALLTPGSAFDFSTSIDGNGDFVFTADAITSDVDRVQEETAASNNDVVYAGPGPDWIAGGSGSDTLHGEDDDDIIYGDDLIAMPTGAEYGNDILFGGNGDDMLFGNQGDDELYGNQGNDMLFGDDSGEPSGKDKLYGGDGVDELHGLGGDDYLSGGPGDETVLLGGDGNDFIDGDAGNDILTGGAGDDNLRGGEGDDTINAGGDNDILNGGVGNDTLNGDAGNDTLHSSPGLNLLNGGADNDTYIAALGHSPINTPDIISDSGGTDRIKFDELVFANRVEFTDQGGDLLVQYSPNDALLVSGGAGGGVIEEYEFSDGRILTYGDLNNVAKVARGSSNEITAFDDWYEGDANIQNLDMLTGNDAVLAYEGDDFLSGNAGNDMLDGGADNDTLNGGAGNDRLFGATGDDVLNGGTENDLLAAGDGNDTLNGGDGIDVLRGGNGNDILNGDDGNDFIQGDRGTDTLQGGLGSDIYAFRHQDDPESGVLPRTTIIDTDDSGGNTIQFLGGLDADDITLINDLDTGDLEIQYGYHEDTLTSSIYLDNSAEGEVITEFQFDDGTTITFEDLCVSQPVTCEVDDLIFESGFEQPQATISSLNKQIINEVTPNEHLVDPVGQLGVLVTYLIYKLV